MIDRREEILDQLFTVLTGIEGVVASHRNRAEFETNMRPCIVQLDGSEDVDLVQAKDRRGGIGLATSVVVLKPEIFVLLKDSKPKNLTVGQDLNMFRVRILKAIWDDATLKDLVTSNGSIEYGGCLTDLQTGGTVQGEMQMAVHFSYPLKLSEL